MRWLVWTSLLALMAMHAEAAPWTRHVVDDSGRGADGVKLADVNGDGLPDIVTGWEEGGVTRLYLNPGPAAAAQPWPAVTVGETPDVEDAVFADMDGDGAVDVVSCCEGGTQRVFVHWAPADPAAYNAPRAWVREAIPASAGLTKWMFAMPMDVDQDGDTDIVAASKGGGAAVGWFETPDKPRHLERYVWHPLAKAGWVMSVILRDMNSDGATDIVFSDRKGPLRACRWLENPGGGKGSWRDHVIGAAGEEVMFMTLADIDGDGLEDALAAVRNESVMVFRRLDASGTQWEKETLRYPANTGTAKAVAAAGVNKDGTMDLVLTCEHAHPPKSGVVWLEQRPEGGDDTAWIPHDIAGPEGIKFDRIELLDLNGDGSLDVLTCEERHNNRGLGVVWYENPEK